MFLPFAIVLLRLSSPRKKTQVRVCPHNPQHLVSVPVIFVLRKNILIEFLTKIIDKTLLRRKIFCFHICISLLVMANNGWLSLTSGTTKFTSAKICLNLG